MVDTLEVTGTVVGLVYLWLEYKASVWLWVAGVIMPAIYLVVYYRAGLYADWGINVYYLIAAVYGLLAWTCGDSLRHLFHRKARVSRSVNRPITRTPLRALPVMALLLVLLWGTMAVVLVRFTDSNVPGLDAFTTALSMLGMWMLARKYVEQWLAWLVVDAVSAGLYVYKALYFTAALYALYAVIAVWGYRKWMIMMKGETNDA